MKKVQLDKSHIWDLVSLARNIKSYSVASSSYQWQDCVDRGTIVFGIKTNNEELVAAGSITFYRDGEQCEYAKANVAVLTNAQVHRAYRGNGYQEILIEERVRFALKNGIRNIQSLVEENNFYSQKNLKKQNFQDLGEYENSSVRRLVYIGTKNLFLFNLERLMRRIFS